MVYILIIVGVITEGFLFWLLGRPIKYVTFRADGIISQVPAWEVHRYKKGNWEGYIFKKRGCTFRVLWEKLSMSERDFPGLISSLRKEKYVFSFPIYEGGVYALSSWGKGRKVTAVFKKEDRIFWVDIFSHSTLKRRKKILDHFLLHLSVDGESISPEAAGKIREIDRKIPVSFMQSPQLLLYGIGGFYLLFVLFAIFIFKNYGKCPSLPDALICSPMSTLNYRTMLSSKYNTCCICLRQEYVSVYSRGKLKFEVPLRELLNDKNFLKKGEFSYGNYRVKIANFHSWTPYLSSHYFPEFP